MTRKLEIVMTTWHVMHYYDLMMALKDDANFTLIPNNNRSWRDERFLALRPIPPNLSFAPFYEKGKYDFAILGVDQQCTNDDLGKTKVFKELNEVITDIPKVVINHGCPVYPEFLKEAGMTDADAEEKCRLLMKALVGNAPMVVNSYTASSEKEWGWGYPIWHGMEPSEWFGDMIKEPRAITALSPAGTDMYYNRACMNDTSEQLKRIFGYELQWARVTMYAQKTDQSWDAYRKFLGKGLVYVDTSFRTPMNRARTEAMLSGCCVVQVDGAHDLDHLTPFGTIRENVVIVPNNPIAIAEKVNELLQNPRKAMEIGQKGRLFAQQAFNRTRYREDWLRFITEELKLNV